MWEKGFKKIRINQFGKKEGEQRSKEETER